MIKRIVKMSFRTEELDNFKEIFNRSKDKIRAFKGNSKVELLQDVNNPEIMFTFSLWESEEALEAYRHSDLFKETWAATKVLFNAKPEAWSTRWQNEGQLE